MKTNPDFLLVLMARLHDEESSSVNAPQVEYSSKDQSLEELFTNKRSNATRNREKMIAKFNNGGLK